MDIGIEELPVNDISHSEGRLEEIEIDTQRRSQICLMKRVEWTE